MGRIRKDGPVTASARFVQGSVASRLRVATTTRTLNDGPAPGFERRSNHLPDRSGTHGARCHQTFPGSPQEAKGGRGRPRTRTDPDRQRPCAQNGKRCRAGWCVGWKGGQTIHRCERGEWWQNIFEVWLRLHGGLWSGRPQMWQTSRLRTSSAPNFDTIPGRARSTNQPTDHQFDRQTKDIHNQTLYFQSRRQAAPVSRPSWRAMKESMTITVSGPPRVHQGPHIFPRSSTFLKSSRL